MENPWGRDAGQLYAELRSSPSGLDSATARARLLAHGPNEIATMDRRTALGIFFSQFTSPLLLVLIFASLVAGFLGDQADAAIILAIVAFSGLLGFYQEYKSDQAVAALRKFISFRAKVLRDGKETSVDTKELVPGDIVFLAAGDLVPADLRLIRVDGLHTDESLITGESFPVEKDTLAVNLKGAAPAQQSCVAFMGTVVAEGSGMGIVFATAKETFFGRTATIMSAKEPPTEFHRNMMKFGNFLMKIILTLTVVVFAANAILGKGVLDSLLFALALAVGITPELLPIIITVSLSSAAVHLARKSVVVKKLASIEDLGNVDVMCVDKTGTLTENKVTLEDYMDAEGKKSDDVLALGLLCNSALVEGGKISGNTIDSAIWEFARRNAMEAAIKPYKKMHEIEFDYHRRRFGTVVRKGKALELIVKGAPESVLPACDFTGKGGAAQLKMLEKKFRRLSATGLRVVAVASKSVCVKKEYSAEDETGLDFRGFLAFMDPPKSTTKEAVHRFHMLGVDLKILTGDNELVTEEICRKVGVKIKGRVMLGTELHGMGGQEFLHAISQNNVFARVTPEQKLAIVAGLTKLGHVVGFLGDGVNDAPALKAADVGISVDTAIDVAKDSADIILLQKSLLVLSDGILEGRKTFGNTMKYILNTVSANFGNMFTVAISSLFLKFIPMLPSQILAANLISDAPLMAISTDKVDDDDLRRPSKWSIKSMTGFMVFFGLISTVFDLLTMGVLLLFVGANPSTFRTAWFLESILSEIIVTFAIRTRKRFWQSSPSRMLVFSSVAAALLTIGLVYSPLGFLFQFDQLAVPVLAAVGFILLGYFVMVELAKKRFYRRDQSLP